MNGLATTRSSLHWQKPAAVFRTGACSGWIGFATDLHEDLAGRWVQRLPKGSRVLKTDLFEEAVGAEAPFDRLERLGWYPIGVDVGPDLALAASRRLATRSSRPPAIVIADVGRLPFADGSLDAVFSNSTLDHFASFQELDDALAELHRILRPGGHLLLTLDNPINPLVSLRNALPRSVTDGLGITEFYVGKTYSLRQAGEKLRRLRFEIEATGTIAHVPRYIAIRLFRLATRWGLTRWESRLNRLCRAFESLSRWPTAQLTGHFVWLDATKTR